MELSEIKFSEDHIWVLSMGNSLRLGLTEYAQEQLGEIVEFIPTEADSYVDAGDTIGEIESQKAVVELVSPVSGTILSINDRIIDDPSIINIDPYGRGWLVEIEPSDMEELDNLMDEDAYDTFVEE